MAGKSKSSRKGSNAHGSSSSSSQPQTIWPPPTSFLFVVNTVSINDDRTRGGVTPRVVDGRWLPPMYQAGFGPQTPGTIYRWNGGEISTTTGYKWDKGYGCAPSGDTLKLYKSTTMFYCNPFYQFLVAHGDATTRDLATSEFPHDRWFPLNFRHEETLSRLDYTADQYLAGNAANFINSLGLNSYQNTEPDAPEAGGLAGDLAILIGLVAFSCKRRELGQVLINDRAWGNYEWRGHSRSSGRRDERGIVVSIYLDPDNEVGSTFTTLGQLEWESGHILK